MESRWRCGDGRLSPFGAEHPDWLAAHGRAGDWSVLGASAVGQLHLRANTPRDDALLAGGCGPWLAAAVADGIGSAALSRFGATVAVHAVCEALLDGAARSGDEGGVAPELALPSFSTTPPSVEATTGVGGTRGWRRSLFPSSPPLSTDAMQRAFAAAHEQVLRAAEALQTGPEALHCTLLAALLDTSSGSLVVGQVGDGAIVGYTLTAGGRLLVEPPGTGQAGETYLLTLPDWSRRFASAAGELSGPGAALFLMTDGVADDVTYPPPADVLTRFTRQMAAQLLQPATLADRAQGLLRWLGSYAAQGSFDDRTLLALVAEPAVQPEAGAARPAARWWRWFGRR